MARKKKSKGIVGDIQPNILRALGRMIVNWTRIEELVNRLFAHITGAVDGAMYVVTTDASQAQVTKWTRTLLETRTKRTDATEVALTLELFEILSAINDLRGERNTYVHGLWFTDGPGLRHAGVQTFRMDRESVIHELVVTAPDLDDLTERIVEVGNDLVNAMRRAGIVL